MEDKIREKFEEIATEAVEKASKVDCSVADYCDGLGVIMEEIELARDAAEEDLAKS